jgi:DNA-binding response OmpR family regulator
VLVIDEDATSRTAAVRAMRREGMRAEGVDGVEAARFALTAAHHDLVVLDVAVGGLDGFALITEIRSVSDVPIIVVSERAEEPLRLLGLELGADDYLAKPCSALELVARARAVLRRTHHEPAAAAIESGPLRIDLARRQVTLDGRPVELTSREFDVLTDLALHPGTVRSRAALLHDVWHSSVEWQDPATVTEHVRRIRAKVEPDPARPRWIETVRGVGYRFRP